MSLQTNTAQEGEAGESLYERRRRAILEENIPRWYSPAVHLAIPSVLGLCTMIGALSFVRDLKAIELLAVPLTLLLAFVFEWRVHKYVLHHRAPLLSELYVRHELQHHVIYTYEHFTMRSRREFRLVLVPAYAVVLIALIDAPLAYALWKLVTPNVGLVYLATAMFFFLSYEWLHLSYHMPPESFVGRLGVIARLREHHRRHHDPRLMKTWNFNVTVPVFDWIKGTRWSPEREAEHAARRARRAGRTPAPSESV